MPVKETPAHNDPAVSMRAKSAEPASAAGDAQGTWQPDPIAAAASRGELQRRGKPPASSMSNLDWAVFANA